MSEIKIDRKEFDNLGKDVRAATIISLGRMGERGYQLLREEVPKDTRNLMQGVASPDLNEGTMTVTLVVSARSARTGGSGTLHLPSGKTRTVSLRPQRAFNYAEVVAKGRPAIEGVLIIPVNGTPNEAYITANGKTYVVRRGAKAQKPNPYDERAVKRLKGDAPKIIGAVFKEFFN